MEGRCPHRPHIHPAPLNEHRSVVALPPFDWLRTSLLSELQAVSLPNGLSAGRAFHSEKRPGDERRPYDELHNSGSRGYLE
jgi:hypothetical protein